MPSPSGPRPAAVRPRLLAELAPALGATTTAGDPHDGQHNRPQAEITGITHDSRRVRPGDLYVALPGARFHGAQFVVDAVRNGAAAVLTDSEGAATATRAGAPGVPLLVVDDPRGRLGAAAALVYGEPARALTMLGITGTNGKTTTAYLVEAGLHAAGRATGLIGTVETRIGTGHAVERLPSARTTPEAPDVQALLAVMRERDVDAAVMEVSSHALALGRVDGIVFDVAAFTNLSEDHLDFHADLEDYFAAKASLFTPARSRCAVINIDDPYGARLAAGAELPVVTVSPSGRQPADWRVAGVDLGPVQSTFTLVGEDAHLPAAVQLPGEFNVANAAVALAMLVAAGVPAPVAAHGVASCRGVPGRMERVDLGQPFQAVVDYAHTPEAVGAALAALRPTAARRLLVVLGCGGDRDPYKRPLMGEVGARGADVLVVTDDNPRSEDPAAIRAAVLAGAFAVPAQQRGRLVEIADRAEAIRFGVRDAGPGDVLLIAGKGHEQGQDLAGAVAPFDDREVLAAALGNGGATTAVPAPETARS